MNSLSQKMNHCSIEFSYQTCMRARVNAPNAPPIVVTSIISELGRPPRNLNILESESYLDCISQFGLDSLLHVVPSAKAEA